MSLFRFARQSELRRAFQPSAAGPDLYPTELESTIALVHPAIGRGETALRYLPFTITGAAGVAAVTLSVCPDNTLEYFLALEGNHNDPVARRMQWFYEHPGLGIFTVVRDTFNDADYPAGTVVNGVAFPWRWRAPILTPGFRIGLNVVGIAAGQQGTIRGIVIVTNGAEPPPPLF